MGDNKAAPSALPQGGGASRRPLGFCCLRFGKEFLCFGMISGAHSWISPPLFFWAGRSSWVMSGLITKSCGLIIQFNELINWLSVSI